MRPYSLDLRQRVIAALDAGEGTQPEIAARFRVSVSFITRLLKRRRRTGSVAPAPHGGGHPPALDSAARRRLRRLVRDQPDATLEELAARVGVPCGRMAIFRTLRELKSPARRSRSMPASGTRPASGGSGGSSGRPLTASIPGGWCSSTRRGPTRR